MSVMLLFVFVTSMFVITIALWQLIVIASTSVFKLSVFCLVVDLAVSFNNCANRVNSSKTVHGLIFREVVTTGFCSDIANDAIKSVLPRKPVHKFKSSKRLTCARVRASSVRSNVGSSGFGTRAYVNRSSSVKL